MAIDNSIGIFNRLRTMCQDATDVNRLTDVSMWLRHDRHIVYTTVCVCVCVWGGVHV